MANLCTAFFDRLTAQREADTASARRDLDAAHAQVCTLFGAHVNPLCLGVRGGGGLQGAKRLFEVLACVSLPAYDGLVPLCVCRLSLCAGGSAAGAGMYRGTKLHLVVWFVLFCVRPLAT